MVFQVSSTKISRAEDKALDEAQPKKTSGMTGITVSSGPADDTMDIDTPNGNKRKSRSSIAKVSYKDASDSDGEPQVGLVVVIVVLLFLLLFFRRSSLP